MRFDVKSGVKDWRSYSFILKLGPGQKSFTESDMRNFFYGFECLLESERVEERFRNYSIKKSADKYYLLHTDDKNYACDLFGRNVEEEVARFDFNKTICPKLLDLRVKILDKSSKFWRDLDSMMDLIGSYKIKIDKK